LKNLVSTSFIIYGMLYITMATAQSLNTIPLDADIYYAYGTQKNIIIEGRIIKKRNSPEATAEDSKLTNFWRNLKRLVNDEKKEHEGTNIILGKKTYSVKTDKEGYFNLETNTPDGLKEGWNTFLVNLTDDTQIEGNLFIAPKDNQIGIISDFDDTVIDSDVSNKQSMLKKSLLQNYKQRKPVDGMPALYQSITQLNPQPLSTPVFFVSASPRQIQKGIINFLAYNKFPKSLVVTKTITGKNKYSLTDHKDYKFNKIQEIFERLPQVKFILVGDDGESDPESFSKLQKIYANRIIDVWIHQVHPDINMARYPNQKLFQNSVDHLTLPTMEQP